MLCAVHHIAAAGSYFGDIIITSAVLRDTTTGNALTYCEVARLKRDDLYEVLEEYPNSEKTIKEASLKLAFQRAVLIVSAYAKTE